MRLLVFLLFTAVVPCAVCAQEVNGTDGGSKTVTDSVALGEVVVSTSRVRDGGNSLRLFPTKGQKANSTNGYSLLSRLSLPGVTVDAVARTISVPGTLGSLQVRINDVVATPRDLLSLDIANVKYVDYIRNAGVRYGGDVDFVINIVVARARGGYTVGAEAMQTLTSMRNNEDVFARFNKGKHEFGFSYSFGYDRPDDQRYEETAYYQMPGNTVNAVKRTDKDYRVRNVLHDLQLQYSLADSARYTLQATLGGTLSRMPENSRTRTEESGGVKDAFRISSKDNTSSAFLDLYFTYNLSRRQAITARMVGNYSCSDYYYAYGGASPYAYNSSENSHLLGGELVYDISLRPFKLSAGFKYLNEYSGTSYGGDISTGNSIRNTNMYGFAQISGQAGKFSYVVGLGASRYHYRQAAGRYGYWLFRPQVQLSYSLCSPLRVSYDLTMNQHPPRLSYLGDVAVRNNDFEITVGNPALRINKELAQSFALSLQYPSLYTRLMAYYRIMPHCSMLQVDRVETADGTATFVSSRTNQRGINLFYVNDYTKYDILPGKLSLDVMAGIYRFFNYGDSYTHHHTAFNWRAGAQAYFGRFSFTASVDNGWNFLEGELKSSSPLVYYLTASYKSGDFTVSLFWQHCLQDEVCTYRTELLNRYVHKMQRMYSGDVGNMVTVSFSWRLSHGRGRKPSGSGPARHRVDTGIMKN